MDTHGLPPGQRGLLSDAPRFGLPRYLRVRFAIPGDASLTVCGPGVTEVALTRNDLNEVPQASMYADMHCVMTWSALGTRWTGWKMLDLWERVLRERADQATSHVIFAGLDQAMASIALVDLLREDVMIAHSKDGQQLDRAQGAPYRLVVPQLYGYKHIKYLHRIELARRQGWTPDASASKASSASCFPAPL